MRDGTARGVDAVRTGSRKARSAADGVREAGITSPIDRAHETRGVIDREIRGADDGRGEGRGEEGGGRTADERVSGLTGQGDTVRRRGAAGGDEQGVRADRAGAQ